MVLPEHLQHHGTGHSPGGGRQGRPQNQAGNTVPRHAHRSPLRHAPIAPGASPPASATLTAIEPIEQGRLARLRRPPAPPRGRHGGSGGGLRNTGASSPARRRRPGRTGRHGRSPAGTGSAAPPAVRINVTATPPVALPHLTLHPHWNRPARPAPRTRCRRPLAGNSAVGVRPRGRLRRRRSKTPSACNLRVIDAVVCGLRAPFRRCESCGFGIFL